MLKSLQNVTQIIKREQDNSRNTSKVSSLLPHYLVFELGYTGHYPHYINHLARGWLNHNYPGRLTFVVSPQFSQHHSEVLALYQAEQPHKLQFQVLSSAEADKLVPRQSPRLRAQRSLQEWGLLRQYAQCLKATHCLVLYFDSFQTATLLRQPLPCPFSGIYFRPTLHYRTFNDYLPNRKAVLQEWREQIVLPRVLKHPQLQHLFCLDPFFVPYAHQHLKVTCPLYLPDPVELPQEQSNEQRHDLKRKIGIDDGRITFLLFGALYDRRKGLQQVLDAISELPPEMSQRLCLLLVGQLGDHQEQSIRTKIEQLNQSSYVQIVIREGFIPDDEVALCFQATDIVLAPYQRHIGMSGILVHAAAAQKPIISSNYGLLGELVHQYHLGITVDSTVPTKLAEAIQFCLGKRLEEIGDRQQMIHFAQQNSAENFSQLIFQTLQGNSLSGQGAPNR